MPRDGGYGGYGGFRLRKTGLYKAGTVLSGIGDFIGGMEDYREKRRQQYLQELIASGFNPIAQGLPMPQGMEEAPGTQGKYGFRIARPQATQEFDLNQFLEVNPDLSISNVSVSPEGKKSYGFKLREPQKPRTPGTPQEEFELFRGAQQEVGVPEKIALKAAEESPFGFPSEVKVHRLKLRQLEKPAAGGPTQAVLDSQYMQDLMKEGMTRKQAYEKLQGMKRNRSLDAYLDSILGEETPSAFTPPPGWEELTPEEQAEYKKLKGIQ